MQPDPMKFRYFILSILLSLPQICMAANISSKNIPDFLFKPTGQYNIGVKNFYWINQNLCPDPLFSENNIKDFRPSNKNHCHEIMVKIYYPAIAKDQQRNTYQPAKYQIMELTEKTSIPKEQIKQFSQIKSFSIQNAKIVTRKKFPVILFSPGLGYPSQMYENIITNLVSHGYIVIGINTPFISLVELSNGHIINPIEIKSPISRDDAEKFVKIPVQDIIFALEKIHALQNSNSLFAAMKLNRIGLLGHSIGGQAVEVVAQSKPMSFQALVALDGNVQISSNKFPIPFMNIMSSQIMMEKRKLNQVNSGDNLNDVVISDNNQHAEYSYHLNFTDLSTLQYLPAFQTYMSSLTQQNKTNNKKFDLKLLSHDPTQQEQYTLINPTFLLINKNGIWTLHVYENRERKATININKIPGLSIALNNLPTSKVESLSNNEIQPVKKILLHLFDHPSSGFLGKGNGWEIASAINMHLLRFFDIHLKNKQ